MPSQPMQCGEIIRDTYTIVRPLGSGAFGDVYLARHRYMGLQALKVFSRHGPIDALEEAYLLARLSHPNIVRVFEANEFQFRGDMNGYFSMEYLESGTLGHLANAELPLTERLRLGKDILSGLAFAHAQTPPIIHRDVSPSNILIERRDGSLTAKISDFGLAKHLDVQSLMASAGGKYLYMAPENFLNKHFTATDVYSAAVVLFELFTGTHPFPVGVSRSTSATEMAAAVRNSRAQPLPDISDLCTELGASWNGLFRSALAHDHAARPTTAAEFLRRFNELSNASAASTDSPCDDRVREMVAEANHLAAQADNLSEAIELLERACGFDSSVRERYSRTLSLWKGGVVL